MNINDAIWDQLESENKTLAKRIADLEAETLRLRQEAANTSASLAYYRERAELAERKPRCCATCDSCTGGGICLDADALLSVITPVQSNFCCKYWAARP